MGPGTRRPDSRGGADLRAIRWALRFVAPYRGVLVLIAGASLVSTALGLALPYLSKMLVDDALLGQDPGALWRITALFLGITVLGYLVNVWSGIRYTKVSADILFDMRLLLYRHLQTLSPRFWAGRPLGDVVSRINTDVGEVQRVVGETALGWFGNLVFLLGTLGILVWLDWRLFLVSMSLLPLSVWALVRYRARLEDRIAVLRQRSADIGSFLIESFQGMRLIAASNAQEREAGRFGARNAEFVEALMSMTRLRYLAGGLPALVLSASTSVVFVYGGMRVIGGAITLGTLVAFMAYQMRLLAPVQGLMGIYTNLASVRVSLQRVRALLDARPDVVEAPDPIRLPTARGELVLEGVRLSHGRGNDVLRAVDLRVEPGEVVALVGASGSGKSTLADLLTRTLDPDAGRILLDGHDLAHVALRDLRARIGRVDQEPFIFDLPIEENIRFGNPGASDPDVEAAARAAGIHDFISSLPEGYATVVGERGASLSAGERQRIALARTLLADPAVLVLDEATANLDPAAQSAVVRGYEAAMRGRTTVVISHRPELALRSDRVVVLVEGRIVEEGPPARLAASGGAFARLFDLDPTASGDAHRPRVGSLGA